MPALAGRIEDIRDRPKKLGQAARQAALLVAVAAAGALLLTVPGPTQDPVTIAALSEQEADDGSNADVSDVDSDDLALGEPSSEGGLLDRGQVDRSRAAEIVGLAGAASGISPQSVISSEEVAVPTTAAPTTQAPTTQAPTTQAPTTAAPTTQAPTTQAPTTAAPTTQAPTTTVPPTTAASGEGNAESGDEASTSDGTTSDGMADSDSTETNDSTTTSTTEATTTTVAAAATEADDEDGFVDAGHGVKVPPILLEIRRCESTHNYTAANPSSSARGAYQFLTGSWKAYGHADRYGVTQAHLASPAQQDEAALITWRADGTRPWLASKHCWG